mmetsp:Transcript_72727/g.165033  ORF Transcript_72727/g.165033 Transcript_72727/m.165033 type:complete len:207 (+) Transcript_72727:392-1012(+)
MSRRRALALRHNGMPDASAGAAQLRQRSAAQDHPGSVAAAPRRLEGEEEDRVRQPRAPACASIVVLQAVAGAPPRLFAPLAPLLVPDLLGPKNPSPEELLDVLLASAHHHVHDALPALLLLVLLRSLDGIAKQGFLPLRQDLLHVLLLQLHRVRIRLGSQCGLALGPLDVVLVLASRAAGRHGPRPREAAAAVVPDNRRCRAGPPD